MDKERKTLEELAGSKGIVCPKCGWTSLPVLYTRRLVGGITARVRQCRRCGNKILCRERIVSNDVGK